MVLGKSKLIRVALILPSNPSAWIGGINYLRNLLWAVQYADCQEIQPVVFCGADFSMTILAEFPDVEIVRVSALDRLSLSWCIRGLVRLFRKDWILTYVLRLHRIDVVSHHIPIGIGGGIRQVGWIPDFQHLHLPLLFSPSELKSRDEEFVRLCNVSDSIIVSSQCAKRDLEKFMPTRAARAEVMRFSVLPPAPDKLMSRLQLDEKFGLPADYLFLPNQFWKHKNHGVVIEALKQLKDAGVDKICVMTGATIDYRHPHYYDELRRKISLLGVERQVIMLGVVPYGDLLSLMYYAKAVINPSLFEGWSTTVEEARAMGKSLILSDIPVHREQIGDEGEFFNPTDSSGLAEKILRVFDKPGMSEKYSEVSVRHAFVNYGLAYQSLIKKVVCA